MAKVKICGITNIEDALLASEFGADEIGFNFYEKSKRYISPQLASSISKVLPKQIRRIGVFVNESIERTLEISELASIDAIQLHGDETAAFVSKLICSTDLAIIKAFRVNEEFAAVRTIDFDSHAVLLDGSAGTLYGGTGECFDWQIAKDVSALVSCLYLAGGLTSQNVAEAVREVRPYAVDVASGVEASVGKKDAEKLRAFIENAKNT